MFEIKDFIPRLYQENILKTTKEKNTLVCLPTGTGKTKNAILLAIHRLNTFPDSKTIILSPTKPLSNQICEECKSSTDIPASQINLLTGMLKPDERKKFFEVSRIIVATPQTIANDSKNNLISLKDVSLLVIDECHRSRQKYANTTVSSVYISQSTNPRILALTASPGATKEKIGEICKNLYIEDVEIRTEEDPDVLPYIQKKEIEYVKLDLPAEIKQVSSLITEVYKEKLSLLKNFGMMKPVSVINKRDLLFMQKYFQNELRRGNKSSFAALSLIAQAIKIGYMLELLETQSTLAFQKYIKKLSEETSKAAKVILNHTKIQQALKSIEQNNATHPKLTKMKEIVTETLRENEHAKMIIFANYRSMVDELKELLASITGAKPAILVGQKLGFSQKEQMEIIEKFNSNVFNILITTSIGEEGIHLGGSLELAVMFDSTGSEIRKIQRSGRVARVKPGKIIHLITKGTRDEALLWTSHKKEKKMQSILKKMKQNIEKQEKLF